MRTGLDAIVIGAGPAGLATSRELRRAGIEHAVLERGDAVGASWADFYDSLVLHTARALSALPGMDFPRGTPVFPTRLDFLAYLHAYARECGVPVQTGADVGALERRGEHWRVRTRAGAELSARAVVVATGIASSPFAPELPGLQRFGGRVLHSREYRRPAPFEGSRVIVVGAGNSAADVAVDLARAGIDVTLSVRRRIASVPARVAGLPVQYVGLAVASLPPPLRRWLGAAIGGRVPCPHPPVIGRELSRSLRAGTVRLKGGIEELRPGAVRFADGSTLPADAIVLATGFRPAVGFLDGLVRRDACGFPLRVDRVTSADAPGLFFVGHRYDIRGALYNIGRDAVRAASAVRSALDGAPRTPTERRRPRNER